jgi:hypothetical protein
MRLVFQLMQLLRFSRTVIGKLALIWNHTSAEENYSTQDCYQIMWAENERSFWAGAFMFSGRYKEKSENYARLGINTV